jgi:hypothetical protein
VKSGETLKVFAIDQRLFAGDILVGTPGTKTRLALPGLGTMTLLEDTRIQFVNLDEQTNGFRLINGQVMFEFDGPGEVIWVVADSILTLQVPAGTNRFGIQAIVTGNPGPQASAMTAWASLQQVVVATGELKIGNADDIIAVPKSASVGSDGRVTVADLPRPAYLDLGEPKLAKISDQVMPRFASPADPLEACRQLVASKQRDQRDLGLALQLAVDDYRAGFEALRNQDSPELRFAAARLLRDRLRIDPAGREEVLLVLPEYLDPTEAQLFFELLLGYAAPLDTGKTFQKVAVDSLASNELAIRELAFMNLQGLVPGNFNYQPDAPLQKRTTSVTQWKKWFKQKHGD